MSTVRGPGDRDCWRNAAPSLSGFCGRPSYAGPMQRDPSMPFRPAAGDRSLLVTPRDVFPRAPGPGAGALRLSTQGVEEGLWT